MNFIRLCIRQPVTIAVGVILLVLAGFVGLWRIPVQLTPNVEDTIIAVTTTWEGASPEEIEQEIVDAQEDKLQGLANLRAMTSSSLQGVGSIRLEFQVGTPKEVALREVSDKLREVPSYPENVDEPVVDASDPENRDYIAWIILECSDPAIDVRTLQDFAEDRIKPVLERVEGVSEVNVLGGREREVQVRFDPLRLAQRGLAVPDLVEALRRTNRNFSGGALAEDKSDVRLRLESQYHTIGEVESTLVATTGSGPVFVRDVAQVSQTYKEANSFVHSRGVPCLALNAQKEVGANLMSVMNELKRAVARLNAPGELLESQARTLGLAGTLSLAQVYDQTVYIDDALQLVQDNIWLGGALAIGVLLLFLRSARAAGIIALSIPISIIGAIAAMVAMGRTINVISLAGMAFAVGMVVDNAIVVLENIYRHLALGKSARQAALDATEEVWGAVVASTLTTVVVFIPILLIQDEAGQLFRDISLAIVASITLSMLVSITVVPAAAARLLKQRGQQPAADQPSPAAHAGAQRLGWIARHVHGMGHRPGLCALLVFLLTGLSVAGTWWLMPPSDYLPQGNRNLAFGLLIPPPGYSLEQRTKIAQRLEQVVKPFWEAGRHSKDSAEYERAKQELPSVPTFDMRKMAPGDPVVPPPLENYFIVSFEGAMFHGGISTEGERVVDLLPLFQHATRSDLVPGVLAFAFQVPLFQLGGRTGSAVKVNFKGDDLDQVSSSALAVYGDLMARYGAFSVQPDPSNFNLPQPELRVRPNLVRLGEAGWTASELGLVVQALGDGALVGDYRIGGQSIDLKVIAKDSGNGSSLSALPDTPVATPQGGVVPLSSLADWERTTAAAQINREGRQRAVTLQFTAPPGMALESAIDEIQALLGEHRAKGTLPASVATDTTGSASKLASVRAAMLGDGTLLGTLSSALLLALLVVYLVMCVLFQSFISPLIILFSVPLAAVGGFAALRAVHTWSLASPYMPVQNLDVLTMLGFVILIGVVVNNAILIVHQTENFQRGTADDLAGSGQRLPLIEAVAQAVDTRVRPIFMTTLTSLGGLAPLVLMPGSGSELYRGLGAVVLGGLLCSTVFTLVMVPALLVLRGRLFPAALAQPKDDERGGGAFGVAAHAARAGLVLLCVAGLFPGCGSLEEAPDSRAARSQAGRWRLEAEASLGPAMVTVQSAGDQGEQRNAEQQLAPRRAQLDALGGPEAYAAKELELPPSLLPGPTSVRSLDLAQAQSCAAQHNLGLSWTRLTPAIQAASTLEAKAQFDMVLFADLLVEVLDEPRVVPVLGSVILGSPQATSDHQSLELGLEQRLESGAVLSASALVDRAHDSTSGIDFSPDPALSNRLALSVTQPLLRGAGRAVNTAEIELARNGERRAQAQVEAAILDLVGEVQHAYWDLVEAWKRVEIQEQLTALGEQVQDVLEKRQAFDAAPAQFADALATVEERRTELVRARREVLRACDALKALMNDPALPVGGEELLRPTEPWRQSAPQADLRASVLVALDQRPELRQVWLAIDDSQLREQLAQSAERVRLDLRGGVVLAGLDDELDASLADVAEAEFPSAFLGLALELPLGNRAASAQRERARLGARQAALDYQRIAQQILVEVKSALRDVTTTHELIGATRSLRLARTENLRALLAEEERRSELTPEFLALKFQRQQLLALAQAAEVRALADHERARARLERALGASPGSVSGE